MMLELTKEEAELLTEVLETWAPPGRRVVGPTKEHLVQVILDKMNASDATT